MYQMYNMSLRTKTVLILVLISANTISFVQSEWKIVLNEINLIDPKQPKDSEYIELTTTCESEAALRGYKLIGFNCQKNSGTIDLVITLWNERINKNGFFTIGGSKISTADLKYF